MKTYKHVEKLWKHFKIKTTKDYHNLYLETDVLLLSDTFENFRYVCMKYYKLDPCWYFTAPSLAWDACLKKSGIQLELLSDPDMFLMCEKGIRGGVSMIFKRYSKSNNTSKYMGNQFDPNEKPKYIFSICMPIICMAGLCQKNCP